MRPMESNEILDAAVGAYQNLGGTILRYTAAPTVFCLAAVVFVFEYMLTEFGVTSNIHSVSVQVGEAVGVLAVALLVAAPLFVLGISYSSAFTCGVVSDFMVGNAADPDYRAKRALELMPRLVKLTLWTVFTALSGVVAATGLFMVSALIDAGNPSGDAAPWVSLFGVLAIIAAVVTLPIVLIRQALAVPLVVIENLKPREASKRSAQLLKSFLYHPSGYNTAFGMVVLVVLLTAFIYGGIEATLGIFNVDVMLRTALSGSALHDIVIQAVHTLPWFLTLWTVVPVWCTNATILYYERRTRIEGYDIEALAQDLKSHAKQNRFDL